jgi:Ca2+-binding RTX toxin-like protein
MGGVDSDDIFGDDEDQTAGTDDGTDILLGDNGRIILLGEPGILRALSTAVDTIETTDDTNETGGADRIRGSLAPDVILGGVNGVVLDPTDPPMDELYGNDDAFGDPALLDDGDDVILGDNGLLDFGVDFDRLALDLIETNPRASDMTVLGGPDLIAGNAGQDTAMGGVGGDFIFGDDPDRTAAALDLDDMLLGDNGRIDLLPVPGEFVFFGGAVETTRATDDVRDTGGSDEISGNAGRDIIAGGVFGDLLHGYAALDPADAAEDDLLDSADIILGDNARLAWASDGDFEDVNADIAEVNPDLAGLATTPDTDLTTLDIITTELPSVAILPDDLPGGRDLIFGDAGRDVAFGGTGTDRIWGDDGDEAGDGSDAENDDLLFGDHGRLYPHFSVIDPGNRNAFPSRNFFAIDIEAEKGGEGDLVFGEEGDDVILGQQGDDRLFGGTDDDDMIGGHNVETGIDELGSDIEAVAAPASDINDIMDGDSGDDAMAGDNAALWRNPTDPFVPGAFDLTSPRFRVLSDTLIYDANGIPQVTEDAQEDPNGSVGRTIILLDHDAALEGIPAPRPFGADYMAGGADNDILFGELADDVVQGDGSIDPAADPEMNSPSFEIVVDDSAPEAVVGDTDETLWFNVAEADTDGDDYMEGSGGGDLLFGGLGQDDLIGGNSDLFGLDTPGLADDQNDPLRPDGSDVIFGGAANTVRMARNDYVGSGEFGGVDDDPQIVLADRHARDADVIVGDNADIFRLVEVENDDTSFLTFNYDAFDAARGDLRIVPRGVLLLDYTPDPDLESLGAGDLVHGESGDDLIHGETGDDVLFGESDDDDVIGEKGDDWISSGTGEDGILGDDGILFSSRNSEDYGEPLYGIEAVDEVDKLIRTPGNIQRAIIQEADRLNKSVDLVAFEFGGNDVVFGGLDDDFIHAGEGDDAISGAEALPFYYSLEQVAGIDGNDLLLAQRDLLDPDAEPTVPLSDLLSPPAQIDFVTPFNPGNALYFEKFRESEFALYDEFHPRRKIMLDELGQAVNTFRDGMTLEYQAITTLHAIFGDNLVIPATEFEVLISKPSGQEDFTTVTVGPGVFGTKEELRDAINQAIADVGLDRSVEAILEDGDLRLILIKGSPNRDVAVRVEVTDVFPYLLNFDHTEGRLDERWDRTDDIPLPTDGDDRIFGDTGNDWIVGGSGRDRMYGGRGDDLLNMDDNHDTTAGLWPDTPGPKPHDPPRDELDNDLPDAFQAYSDITYGGAGRDVLILNTGADRAIDWVGEFNSYLTPFAPFGAFHISRNLSPHTETFLLDLSKADGADQTVPDRVRFEADQVIDPRIDDPDPLRNGEPYGELGMVRQQDIDWNDQTGGPDDPQAGNLQGPRIIMRRALFNDEDGTKGAPKNFAIAVESGTWTVADGTLNVAADFGSEAVSFYYVDEILPSYFEILTTINAEKDRHGVKSNAYIMFDYQSPTDFKFAGVDVGLDKLRIGHRTADGWVVDAQLPMRLGAGKDYNLALAIHGTVATLYAWSNGNRIETLSHAFGDPLADPLVDPLNDGLIGLAVDNSITHFDNLEVRILPPNITFTLEDDFTVSSPFGAETGLWSLAGGRYVASPATDAEPALTTMALGVAPATFVEFGATFRTDSLGGLVFDYYGPADFKFAGIRADTGQAVIGHYTLEGWTFDAVADLGLDAGADHEVTLEIRGGSVVMFVDGQGALSHTFNSLLNDGDVGLLGADGVTSFDRVSLEHDDPAYATESSESSALVASEGAADITTDAVLTYDALTPIVHEAIRRWSETVVLDAASLDALEGMSFAIADLEGSTLGVVDGSTITLDANAAGHGWFVDTSPSKDNEFRGNGSELLAVPTGEAAGQMDLLTAVMHEIGHVLGLEDTPSDDGTPELMDDTLTVGTRRAVAPSVGDGVQVSPDASIGDSVSLGDGVQVLGDASIGDGTSVGAGSVIGEGAEIGSNVLMGDGVTVEPGAVVPDGSIVLSGTTVTASGESDGDDVALGDIRARLEELFGPLRSGESDLPWGVLL